MAMIIGVDTGGTFTDFIHVDGAAWGTLKLPSTPHDPAEAVLAGLGRILGPNARVVHGSTVATNALLERKGAVTALVANAGFEDVLEIGRQNRPELYNLACRRRPPLVAPERRFGLSCRIGPDGEVVEPLDPADLKRLVAEVAASGAASAAVCLLFSFENPEHERAAKAAIEAAGVPVSASHEILAEFREYERTSTTVINAYVTPVMSRYISRLCRELPARGLRIMQSNGGAISAETAMRESVRTILSGPAGGAVGAFAAGKAAGFDKLIAFDMGGTSTDVCLMDGALPMGAEGRIDDMPVKAPMIDIHTVGAGGGSIARLDAGGALVVGPESAGADPGPACYGKGTALTVTDANLFLGRLVPERFLGGAMRLEPERAEAAVRETAERAGLDPFELAEGVLAVANANMERAIRVISVERGHDPREFSLLSFGGAGGLHCAFLARQLFIPRVIVPQSPGLLSAWGMVFADVVKDYSLTVMRRAGELADGELDRLFAPLDARGLADLAAEGFAPADVAREPFLDMRYLGQSFELVTPLVPDFIEAFHALHERLHGHRLAGREVEVVNIRLRLRATPPRPEPVPARELCPDMPKAARLGRIPARFDGKVLETAVLDRQALLPGNRFDGPAVVVEYSSTLAVPPFARVEADALGNLILEVGEARGA